VDSISDFLALQIVALDWRAHWSLLEEAQKELCSPSKTRAGRYDMNRRSYCMITGIIFGAIALTHLLRIFYGWRVLIGVILVPGWVSWVAVIVAGYLGYEGLRLSRGGLAFLTELSERVVALKTEKRPNAVQNPRGNRKI